VIVRSPDADRAAAELNGQIASRDGDQLVVTGADPAELNARLVTAGLRVTEIRPERRSLEDLVLDLTGPGADRVDRDPDHAARRSMPPDGGAS
jgi:ABC-2 type transport system ATP-binding protein